MESDAYGPLHPVTVFGFAHPDGFGAVGTLLYFPVAGDVAGLAVVVEGVPFHSSAYPRSGHSHICRFHDLVAVEDVVAVGLVHGKEQPAPDFRENAELDILIFKIETIVGDILPPAGHIVVERVGIDTPFRPLIGPVPLKNRSLFRRVEQIGGHGDFVFPGPYAGPGVLRF